jgi:glycosyltransferase involved in cell wall biosynthesis
MRVVAVIPAYNEAKAIGRVVEGARKVVDKVIVVDDGSIDKTAETARAAGAEVVVLKKNMGKARALKRGLKDCRGYDAIILLDGDLQHLPEEIPLLLEGLSNGGDLCLGNRFFSSYDSMPRMSVLSNRAASFLLSFLTGQKITDPQSGFRAIRGDKLDILELRAERYAIEHVMLLEAARKKFNIKEVPISCVYGDEKSDINPFKDTLKVIYHVLRFLLSRKP